MIRHGLRALWEERRPTTPPARVWRDWALVGVAVTASVVEVALRVDRSWLAVVLGVSLVIAGTLPWRRTRPFAMVAVAFGTLIAFDVARIVVIDARGLASIAAALALPYAVCRWGSGREAVAGLGMVLVWLGVTHVADPATLAEVVAGYAFFLFAAALGAAVRFHATTRLRDIEQAELRQRHELARDLHDTIGHHVSAIAVQAQAGRALAASDPDRALAVLGTIEGSASRALAEMRAIVGVLRDPVAPELAPQPGVADLVRLADPVGTPRVEVHLSGDLDAVAAPVGIALYRIAQEAVTNARRHARAPTHVVIEVRVDAHRIQLQVRDDGRPVPASRIGPGFGLPGMRERAALFGGTLDAGPGPEEGWIVAVTLPRASTGAPGFAAADPVT